MGKIGVRLMVHPASVTNAVDRLAAAGLVRRVAHPTDRRAVLARSPTTGASSAARATKVLAAIRFGMEDLPDGECDRLTDAVTRCAPASTSTRADGQGSSPEPGDGHRFSIRDHSDQIAV